MLRPAELQRNRLPGEKAATTHPQAALLPGRRMGLVYRAPGHDRADFEPRIAIRFRRFAADHYETISDVHLQNCR